MKIIHFFGFDKITDLSYMIYIFNLETLINQYFGYEIIFK